MCKYFPIYEEAVSHICNCSIMNYLIYQKNLIFFFISVVYHEEAAHLEEDVDGEECPPEVS